MNFINTILLSILAVQVVLAAGIFYSSNSVSGDVESRPLLETSLEAIDKISIEDSEGLKTVLTKRDGKWILSEYHELPANSISVENMLSRLKNTSNSWPVTTTSSSQKRFKVADDGFNKKIVLARDESTTETLYLGTSPGFRQLHVRRLGEEEVYAVKLNSHDFPVKTTDLLDKTILQPEGEIKMIKGPDFSFTRQENIWQPENMEGEADSDKMNELTTTLARLKVQGVEKVSTDDQHAVELNIKTDHNDYRYRLFKKEDKLLVTRDDLKLAFSINKSDYETITTQNAKTLLQKKQEEEMNTVHEQLENEKSSEIKESSSQGSSNDNQNNG